MVRDDTPCCAESSLRRVLSVASGLPCSPDAETLPRRDETQFLKKSTSAECRDYEENTNNARRTLEITRASPVPCKVTTPINPNGSSWKQHCASDWSKIDTDRLNPSCSKQDLEHVIIESQRIRHTKSEDKSHKDHIADRGQVSMSHYSMVHTPISRPDSHFLEAKAALDEEWKNVQKLPAWDESNVSSKAVIGRAQREGKKVHFATLTDFRNLV